MKNKKRKALQQATLTRTGRTPFKFWKDQEYRKKIILPPPTFPMKFISWNVRGLNSPSKKICLKTLISKGNPSIMMIQETKCTSTNMEKIAIKCWRSCNVIAIDDE